MAFRRFCSSTRSSPVFLHRQLPQIRDFISPQPAHLLNLTLSPYLDTNYPRTLPNTTASTWGPLIPGQHLVYFPPQLPEYLLLPDGSDGEQAPYGTETTHRRLWAAGSIEFCRDIPIGAYATMDERVVEVNEEDGGRVSVWFERTVNVDKDSCEGSGPALIERRNILFLPSSPSSPSPSLPKRIYKCSTSPILKFVSLFSFFLILIFF